MSKKKKWYEKQIDRRISRYEDMSDEEFDSVYKKELALHITGVGIGFIIVIVCLVCLVYVIR